MNQFLEGLSQRANANTRIVLFVDGASWHRSDDLEVPVNIMLYHFPAYSPELNPIERLWDYLKENYLSGRVFADMDEIFEYGIRAWQALSSVIIKSVCATPWFH